MATGYGPAAGQISKWPLVAMRAMDINTDPHCGRTTQPDMVLGSSFGQNATMTLSGI